MSDDAPAKETYFSTWKNATFDPAALFPDPAPAQRRPGPLGFAIVVGMIVGLSAAFWSAILDGSGSGAMSSALSAVTLGPIGTIVSVYFTAALIHPWLLVVRGNKGTFRDTVAS